MIEVNIDTLVGPTHTFGGLSWGNIASKKSRWKRSFPKRAALQGLEKMKLLWELGSLQMILPPQERPDNKVLRTLGFDGRNECFEANPQLLLACSSSSSMWTANSATVTPSCDTHDGKVHITISNLAATFHRSIEAPTTELLFRQLFSNKKYFTIHEPLPATPVFFDEGAANHIRFCNETGEKGIHLFVWGRDRHGAKAECFPSRQSKEAQEAIVRRHTLLPQQILFAEQNPHAIDKGVFHNDVIATGHTSFFLVHEMAYVNIHEVLRQLQRRAKEMFKHPLLIRVITEKELPLSEAIRSYFFNTQIVSLRTGEMAIIAPEECKRSAAAKRLLEELVTWQEAPITEIFYLSLNESMGNGGGPACLRLRVPLKQKEIAALPKTYFFSETTYTALKRCIEMHYPESIEITDFADAGFHKKNSHALAAIQDILVE